MCECVWCVRVCAHTEHTRQREYCMIHCFYMACIVAQISAPKNLLAACCVVPAVGTHTHIGAYTPQDAQLHRHRRFPTTYTIQQGNNTEICFTHSLHNLPTRALREKKKKKLPNEIKISHCNLNKMAVVFLFFVSPDEGSCPLSHKRTGSMKSCRCPAVPAVLLALALHAVFEFSRSPPPDRFPPNGIPSSPVGQ